MESFRCWILLCCRCWFCFKARAWIGAGAELWLFNHGNFFSNLLKRCNFWVNSQIIISYMGTHDFVYKSSKTLYNILFYFICEFLLTSWIFIWLIIRSVWFQPDLEVKIFFSTSKSRKTYYTSFIFFKNILNVNFSLKEFFSILNI